MKLVAETIASQPEEEVQQVVEVEVPQYSNQPQEGLVYAAVQPAVEAQQYVVSQPQAYVAAQPIVPQQVVVQAQPVYQQQAYVAVQPAYEQQQYVINQPIVAQPYLVGQPVAISEPAVASNQFHSQDEIGQYEYGYANEHSFKTEHKTADGVVRGSYR